MVELEAPRQIRADGGAERLKCTSGGFSGACRRGRLGKEAGSVINRAGDNEEHTVMDRNGGDEEHSVLDVTGDEDSELDQQ